MSQFKSPDSSHIFSDLEISDDDGDLNILRSSRKSYSKDRESCDSGNEKSFCKSTTNTKDTASSSHSCENDQRTRKNSKRKAKEKELNLDEPKSKHPSINMPLKFSQTSYQQSPVYLNVSSNVKLKGTIVQHPFVNAIDDLRRNLKLHSTVKDFCTHPVTCSVFSKLSKYCIKDVMHSSFYKKRYAEINFDDDKFENFLKCSPRDLVRKYACNTIHYIFWEYDILRTEWFLTNKLLRYAYEEGDKNEALYFTKFFSENEYLNLLTVLTKLYNVGILVIYDDFRKGNKN
ncbi:uncharacterized protein TNCV_2582771 [Trichonephila clavipes]|nr:uncharacterized protein TNCV_2582771 [Trichonephila clavipes]